MRRSRSRLAAVAAVAACGAPQAPAPRTCPAGAVRIAGPEDVARLAGCTRAGAVTIRTGAALELGPLGALETIDGDLAIGPSVGLADAAFGGLRSVGGTIRVVGNGNLHALRLPRLERAGRVSIEGNSALGMVAMPRLREVRGALIVSGNPDLELVDAGALEAVGAELAITGNANLVLIEAARLQRAGSVRVADNPLLPDDTARALEAKKP
jgi:hypothetical protein